MSTMWGLGAGPCGRRRNGPLTPRSAVSVAPGAVDADALVVGMSMRNVEGDDRWTGGRVSGDYSGENRNRCSAQAPKVAHPSITCDGRMACASNADTITPPVP